MAKVLNGDNGGVSENTYYHHLRVIEDLKRQASAVGGRMKQAKKAAKDDGIDLADLDWAMKERAKTVDQQVASHNRRTAYLRFMKMPVGAALAPLADIKDETGLSDEERHQKWEDEGFVAGKLGQNRDSCPHEDINSIAARLWMGGWDKGQAELAKGFKQKPPEKPKAEPKPAETTTEQAAAAEPKKGPKDEPEVAAAKARGGRKPKADAAPVDPVSKTGAVGITYWHDFKGGRVIENKDGTPPEKGWENITRPEYDKLFAAYKAKADEEWEAPAKPGTAALGAAEAGDDDDGDSGDDEDEDGDEELPAGPTH